MSYPSSQTPLSIRPQKDILRDEYTILYTTRQKSFTCQSTSMLLTVCNEALVPLIEKVITDHCLPLPSEVPSLNLQLDDIIGLVLIPRDRIVRTSFALALSCFHITPAWDIPNLNPFRKNFFPLRRTSTSTSL